MQIITAKKAKMALTFSQKANTIRNTTMTESQHVSDIDFDLLVTRVENTISEDKQRQQPGFTPQELMLRSNPALFSLENVPSGDLTNPREMYTILSNKSKSIEDLAAKFKKELVKSVQTSGSFPKLSRTVSMSDIEHKHNKSNKPSENSHRQMNMLFLKRHNTSVAEAFRKPKELYAENVRAVNLPHIEHQFNGKGDTQNVKERHKTDQAEFPTLVHTAVNTQLRVSDPKLEMLNDKHVSFSDTKLEKWFSEMPNEMFDKAQRAIMEESIKERLQEFKRSRNRKTNFPNQSFKICTGSKLRKVPNTYLELRVDSFGRHLHGEKDDKRNKYRLQQKSMHNLKMREGIEGEPHERLHREDTFPRLSGQNRSLIHGKQKNKLEQEITAIRNKKDTVKVQSDGGFKTLYINDRFGVEIGQSLNQKQGISNYEDYTERLIAMKEMQYQDLLRRVAESPPNSCVDYDEESVEEELLERENTKATVVNLELKKEVSRPRKPYHIEKSLKETSRAKHEIVPDNEITEAPDLEPENRKDSREPDLKHDKIITKIPTAPSVRTSESRSSNSSLLSKNNMEAMKKFNKLEVFAEGHRAADINPHFDNIPEHRFRKFGESYGTSFPSSQRSDAKQQQRQIQPHADDRVLSKEIRRPEADVVFRFEPGEVFVSRKNPNHTLTNTLSSERARVIYGKVAQGAMERKNNIDKHIRKKEIAKENQSTATKSTKLEKFYHSELSRFECRALNGSLSPISPRHDYGTDPLLVITSNNFQELHQPEHGSLTVQRINRVTDAVAKRDVATETDIIGSPNTHLSKGPKSENRSGSGLSDFIIDNNDGESLETDVEEDDISPSVRQRSNHSV